MIIENPQLKCVLNLYLICIEKCYSGIKYDAFLCFVANVAHLFAQITPLKGAVSAYIF